MGVRRRRVVAGIAGLMLVFAPAASAGKGGGGSTSGTSSSMRLVTLDSADGVPRWGQRIRFEVSTTATSQPHVSVDCYQGGARVYIATTGYYDGYAWPQTQTMTLSSTAWTGGAADCQSELYMLSNRGSKTVLSRLAFRVLA